MHIPWSMQTFAHKSKALAVGAAWSIALLSVGCNSMSHTDEGIVSGAGIGAILGTAVGLATHHPLAGAAIGAGTGAVVGGAAGAAEDHAEHRAVQQAQAIAVAQQSKWPTLQEIAQMAVNGTSDQIIINQIRTTGAVYSLTAADIQYLQQNHVSEAIVAEMQATATRPQAVVVQPAPIYYDPYGPPVVRVYGGGWGYRRW